MPIKKLPHPPGRSTKDACLKPWGLTVTEGAAVLGVARHTLCRVINGYAGISPDMAIRLEKAFGSSVDTWLRMQVAYDLARARQHENKIDVQRYATAQLTPCATPDRLVVDLRVNATP